MAMTTDINQDKRHKVRHIFALINVVIGFWYALVWVFVFSVLNRGGIVGEVNHTIVRIEFILSIVILVWFIMQVCWFCLLFGGSRAHPGIDAVVTRLIKVRRT
jgi:hypothetical protein